MSELKDNYEKAVNAYIKAFEDKHECYLDYWVGGNIGEIACFGDSFFNFYDIKLDIDTLQPTPSIFDWQSDGIDYYFTGKERSINYRSWVAGMRYKDFKEK